ncbi:MAG: hypothetical protein ACREC3_02880, partial [Methyloceanibacter sp.]
HSARQRRFSRLARTGHGHYRIKPCQGNEGPMSIAGDHFFNNSLFVQIVTCIDNLHKASFPEDTVAGVPGISRVQQ